MRLVLLLLLTAVLAFANFKLYLKSGDYHEVREYQVSGDRVRYYSILQDDWEEIPIELVDLDKTERLRKAKAEQSTREAREEGEEEQAEREQRREIAAIPADVGAYYQGDNGLKTLKMADYQVVTSKKRHMLQVLSPIPVIAGKASVVIKGAHSNFLVKENRPSFFMRLAKEERFGIVSLTPKKDLRIVENISILPVVKQAVPEPKQMDTFQQQLADGLYRVWPEKALTPGEYALIEFTDTGDKDDVELLVWDFAVQ